MVNILQCRRCHGTQRAAAAPETESGRASPPSAPTIQTRPRLGSPTGTRRKVIQLSSGDHCGSSSLFPGGGSVRRRRAPEERSNVSRGLAGHIRHAIAPVRKAR